MSIDVYLPFLAAALFGTLGGCLTRRLRPSHATWLLSCGSAIISACCLCSLVLLTWALLARLSLVASLGDWSASLFRRYDPVSVAVSVAAIAVLGIVCVRAGRALLRHTRELVRAHRTCRALPAMLGELVVVADDFETCALPGRPGRIVVSRRTLARLSSVQQSAMFTHERSHLRHRHHLHRIVAALAVAANPLLWRVPAAIADTTERWADDDAARYLGTSEAVATALRKAAADTPGSHSVVGRRVAALGRPAPRGSWVLVVLAVVSLIGLVANSAEATGDADQLWHRAHATSSAPFVTHSP